MPSRRFARPKSSTFTCPDSVTMMFAGLISLCTMPTAWAASSADAICRPSSTTRSTGSLPRVDQPFKGLSRHQLHGDEVDAVGLADVVDRDDVRVGKGGGGTRLPDESLLALRVGDDAPDAITFSATVRFRRASIARYTTPMPPAPSGAERV